MGLVRKERKFRDLVAEMSRNDVGSEKRTETGEGVEAEAETDVEIVIEAEIGTGDVGATAGIETDIVTDAEGAGAETIADGQDLNRVPVDRNVIVLAGRVEILSK